MHQHSVFLFSLHTIASLFMFGVIWYVQVVHYPFFKFLRNEEEVHGLEFHQKRTGYLVIPAMIIELGTAIWLLFKPFPNLFCAILLLVLTVAPLFTTFILQVPCHKSLLKNREERTLNRLINTNWIRTWLWSLKAIFLFILLWIYL